MFVKNKIFLIVGLVLGIVIIAYAIKQYIFILPQLFISLVWLVYIVWAIKVRLFTSKKKEDELKS